MSVAEQPYSFSADTNTHARPHMRTNQKQYL